MDKMERKFGNCDIELVRENCQYVENPRIIFFSVHCCQRKGTQSLIILYVSVKDCKAPFSPLSRIHQGFLIFPKLAYLALVGPLVGSSLARRVL
jgi:hypothetical protein